MKINEVNSLMINKLNELNKKSRKRNITKGTILLIVGILIILFSCIFIETKSKWCSFFIILGVIVSLFGFSKFTRKLEYTKGLILNLFFFLVMLLVVFLYDYIHVKNNHAPIFRKNIINNDNEIYYDSIFYDVYVCRNSYNKMYYNIVKNENYNSNFCSK